ncbi:MAG: ABC transporter ATP-binding protein [Acidimicrobiia bacterium]|nr:ABC transporter ATP-binding protein [Acidimicrobiia bacterium]
METREQPAITFTGVTKRYKDTLALDGVDLEVPSGLLTGFLGPNGAGKTTSFRAIMGLTAATAGTIRVLGMQVGPDTHRIVKRVGAIIEEPGLHKTLTARDNLQVSADTIGAGAGRIPELLDFVSLSEVADKKVGQFSKGMRQRLALAQAMLSDPDLLILDEPLDGLDPQGQVDLKERLRALASESNKTIVVSSHNLADVEQLADHVVVINKGRVVTTGTVRDLLGDDGSFEVKVADLTAAQAALIAAGIDSHVASDHLSVTATDGSEISRILAGAGIYPSALVPVRRSLESVFLQLTGDDQ